ncbi:class I cytochrome c [Duganella sp. Leaf126]|uniref:c-type cytochrome n=1 Tax=Duganella sp. Leaf126 TaxID=1736266 RepID=UPI0006FE2300|nr:c-type cytochrome [Duganella sp. Leaf126]KQQ32036.1 class I cytochrome c [Duganella sp. Leaf126]
MPFLRRTVCLALCLILLAAQAHAQSAAAIRQGQRLWQQRCTDCHALDTDETGPRHRGVFGRRSGSVKGYDYSRALKRSKVTWDAAALDRWLTDPEQFIPGQNMDVKVASAAERAALIAYLQSLSR